MGLEGKLFLGSPYVLHFLLLLPYFPVLCCRIFVFLQKHIHLSLFSLYLFLYILSALFFFLILGYLNLFWPLYFLSFWHAFSYFIPCSHGNLLPCVGQSVFFSPFLLSHISPAIHYPQSNSLSVRFNLLLLSLLPVKEKLLTVKTAFNILLNLMWIRHGTLKSLTVCFRKVNIMSTVQWRVKIIELT